MCKCLEEEIEDLKAKVKREAERASTTISELRAALSNTKAELSDVRRDLLEDTVRTLTEERDLARELFQGMVSKHDELLDRCSRVCDEYGDVFSRHDDVLWRSDSEHGKF